MGADLLHCKQSNITSKGLKPSWLTCNAKSDSLLVGVLLGRLTLELCPSPESKS